MPIRLVRNDITKMDCDAVVNTANALPIIGPGCDSAIYRAAGEEKLLAERRRIGRREEGEAFLTPGFDLPARYIIHAVSPLFQGGEQGEEARLRLCYRNSLALALEQGFHSVAFPLIATGSFGYPREEGLRIALDEIQAFLLKHELLVYIVVFGAEATALGRRLDPELKSYLSDREAEALQDKEYYRLPRGAGAREVLGNRSVRPRPSRLKSLLGLETRGKSPEDCLQSTMDAVVCPVESSPVVNASRRIQEEWQQGGILSDTQSEALKERLKHLDDGFSDYLQYLIRSKGMKNAEVYKRAIVDKKVFSKIKNNPDAHPNRTTALCLCIGARLNLDEAVDLLARAGYALSPHDTSDQIFRFFLENQIYDMILLDITLEENGLESLIA